MALASGDQYLRTTGFVDRNLCGLVANECGTLPIKSADNASYPAFLRLRRKSLPMTFNLLFRTSFVAGLFTASWATAATLEERVQQLEDRVTALTQENVSLKKQHSHDTVGKHTAATAGAQGKEAKIAIGGFLQANAEFGDAPDSRFPANDRIFLRRARLGVKGSFAENFEFVFQSDFGNNSIGGISGYRAQLTDCFVNWNRFPAANITLGQFKTPYGYEQLIADPKNLFVERSLPNDQLTLSRQVGAMVSGVIAANKLSYSAGVFNGNGANSGANDNEQFLYVGRLTGTVVQSAKGRLGIGVDGFSTRDTGTFTGRRAGLGLDAQASYGPLDLQAEYLRMHFDRDTGADTSANGWSVAGAYMIVPKIFQGLVRYEIYDPNSVGTNGRTSLWTVGFNYFLKGDDLKLTVNYLLGDPAGPLSNQGRLLFRFQIIF